MSLFRKRFKVKSCRGCGKVLTTDEFYKNKFNEDGLDHYCKFCRQEYNSEWSRKHTDRRYLAQWRYRNKQKKINLISV